MTDVLIPVGNTGKFLRSRERPDGSLDEYVVGADAATGSGWKISTEVPAADDPGLLVRLIGDVTLGSNVEITNDVGNPIPVSGTFFQATQPVSGPVTDAQLRATPVDTSDVAQWTMAKTVDVSASGTTAIHTPAAGKAVRVYWVNISGSPDNSATVKVGLRWTAGGTDFVGQYLSQYGGGFSHHYRAGSQYVEGGADESLVVNLSAAQAITVNLDYEEVTP